MLISSRYRCRQEPTTDQCRGRSSSEDGTNECQNRSKELSQHSIVLNSRRPGEQ